MIPEEIIDDALKKVDNRFLLVLIAAKRIRELAEEKSTVDKKNIFLKAMNEIIEGNIKIKS
jgi:DNA-directed RNA polymerase omega subunit